MASRSAAPRDVIASTISGKNRPRDDGKAPERYFTRLIGISPGGESRRGKGLFTLSPLGVTARSTLKRERERERKRKKNSVFILYSKTHSHRRPRLFSRCAGARTNPGPWKPWRKKWREKEKEEASSFFLLSFFCFSATDASRGGNFPPKVKQKNEASARLTHCLQLSFEERKRRRALYSLLSFCPLFSNSKALSEREREKERYNISFSSRWRTQCGACRGFSLELLKLSRTLSHLPKCRRRRRRRRRLRSLPTPSRFHALRRLLPLTLPAMRFR